MHPLRWSRHSTCAANTMRVQNERECWYNLRQPDFRPRSNAADHNGASAPRAHTYTPISYTFMMMMEKKRSRTEREKCARATIAARLQFISVYGALLCIAGYLYALYAAP
jgi:hypothetical protein